VIIEFENDLSKTGKEAEYQLQEYIAGKWNSGEEYSFTLIATDCIHWKIYSIDVNELIGKNVITVELFKLKEKDNFILQEENLHIFPYFLDQYLFKTSLKKATLLSIRDGFGEYTDVFIEVMRKMHFHFPDLSLFPDIQVAYQNWAKFLSIAYGSFNATPQIFFIHTYLSIFSKIIAYSIVKKNEYDWYNENVLIQILNGKIFEKYNLINFVEDDFFIWVCEKQNFNKLVPLFRKIINKIAEYDFTKVEEDVLKGVYQELIDIDTRHALGEYYTPDWLCEKLVNSLPLQSDSRVLDPSCGSGSFLRAIIQKLIKINPTAKAENLIEQVVGIDIHPLSVQIAKTTILISIADKILIAKNPIKIRIYLSNTLLLPEGSATLFGNKAVISINEKEYEIDMHIFNSINSFDLIVDVCNLLADTTKNKETADLNFFIQYLQKKSLSNGFNQSQMESFYSIYKAFKEAKETNKDTIWKFILQNLYKPIFLKDKFDFVIGNPPWFTYADVKVALYQKQLSELAEKYQILSKNQANAPHLEIAAIFQAHAANYFLKNKGIMAFVMPRSFLVADHHENTRSQPFNFQIQEIWDLNEVSPLFNVPSCVLISRKSENEKNTKDIQKQEINGYILNGKLKYSNLNYEEAEPLLTIQETKWYYSKLGKYSAFTNKKDTFSHKPSDYDKLFKNGAIIAPRNFFFVDNQQEYIGDFYDRILVFKTSKHILADAKEPWKKFIIEERLNTKFIFYTGIAKNVLPFAFIRPLAIFLPIEIIEENQQKRIKLKTTYELLYDAQTEEFLWMQKVDEYWEKNRTQNNEKLSLVQNINWMNKLTDQNLNTRYVVLYTSSAKDANACIIDRNEFDLPFIIDGTTYWYATNEINEAYYLVAYLNANYPNAKIKDFQAKGLFGARHVHKKILAIPFPKFNDKKSLHVKLAEEGKKCCEKVKEYAKSIRNLPDQYELGKIRLNIRKSLENELNAIDELLKKIIQ
jgi:SAM-dependent methyltransferase